MRILTLLLFSSLFITLLHASTQSITLTEEQKDFIEQHPIIHVGGEMDWPPYDFVEEGIYKGLAKDYLDLIEKKSGLTFKIHTGHSWPELMQLTQEKKLDLLPIITKLPKREEFLHFTQPYLDIRQYAYTNQDSTKIKSMQDLYGKKVAIPKGYASIESIKKNHPKIIIVESKSVLDSIDKVITKEVDALIENNALITYYINKYNISDLNAVFGTSLQSSQLNMAVRKDWPILRDILQTALDAITIEEKNQIANKWLHIKKQHTLKLTKEELQYIQDNPVVTIANELKWKPYDFYESDKAQGYSIELLEILLSKAGLKPQYITNHWDRLIKGFQDKKIDVLPVTAPTKERSLMMNYTKSYLNLEQTIVTRKDSDIQSLEQLKGKRVSVVKGWQLTKKLKQFYPQINFVEVKTTQEKLQAVAFNEVDATIENFVVANYIIAENFYNNLKTTSHINIPEYNSQMHIGVQKNNAHLLSILEKALNDLSAQERLQLSNKWLITNPKSKLVLTTEEKAFLKENTIIFGGSTTWAPFIFQNEDDPAYGIVIEYWDLIAKKAGINYQIKLHDHFKDALLGIKDKELDILSTGQTKERLEYALFSDRFESFPLSVATRNNESYIPNAQSLMGKKIAVGENFTAHKILKENHPDLDFILTKTTPEALRLVQTGEAYAAIDSAPTLIYYINDLGLNNIKISGHTGHNFDLKFMIRDDYERLHSIINKTIASILPAKKQELYNRWIQVNYQQAFDYELLWKVLGIAGLIFFILLYFHLKSLNDQKKIKQANEQLKQQSEELEHSNEIIQQTQVELEKSLDNFMTLVDSTIEAILIIKNNEIIYVNDEATELFALSNKTSFIGRTIEEFFAKQSLTLLNMTIKEAKACTEEVIAKRDNHESFPALIKIKKINFQGVEAKTVSIIDLTELKNKERLIQEQSKMVAIGEMIGNIAHQWRQPLSIISTSASALDLYKNSGKLNDEVFFRSTQNILKNTHFLSQTIDDFRNFIKTNKQCIFFNLEKSLEKTLVLVAASLKNAHVKVHLNAEENLQLNNYENELIQALLNILNNAKDALKEKELDEKIIVIDLFKQQEQAIIRIRDNAGGIEEDVMGHIFEPYFTTKHKSMGTGLGLYMTHKIIFESMKGSISVNNRSFEHEGLLCEGAEFIIKLDLHKDPS